MSKAYSEGLLTTLGAGIERRKVWLMVMLKFMC